MMVKNIILLTLDALRADHLSSYGYDRTTSPFIDELAADGLQFRNAYSASSHTREAVPAILTGCYPGEAVDDRFQRSADTIAERLRDGFETAGFHSNPFVSRAYGFDQGFDTFDDDLHLGGNRLFALAQRALDKLRNRHYARAAEINERSLAWLDSLNGDRPFLLWNHYMDPHGPYEAPAEYQRQFHGDVLSRKQSTKLYHRALKNPESITDKERRHLIDLYDAEIAYTDDQLQGFFSALEDRGLLEESLVVITADHGDAFGEHGYYEHPRYLHDELVRVPMILVGSDISPGSIETPTSTLDVVPTILNAVGRTNESLPGEDLLDVAVSPDAYADRTVISQARGENDDSHLRRFAGRGQRTTIFAEYDLETEQVHIEDQADSDSERTSEGGSESRSAGDTVEDRLRAHIEEHATGEVDTDEEEDEAPEEVNNEIQDRLSALGYK